jgi:L-asparaginase/Glu-tRNA(Gln) amidotransferase subunit D
MMQALQAAPSNKRVEESSTRPKLLLLYTGGTMGMKPDPETGSLKPVPGRDPLM